MSDVWRVLGLVAMVLFTAIILRVLRHRPLVPAPAGRIQPPTRLEYKILLMLMGGAKDLAFLTSTLYPLDRTQRGQIPQRVKQHLMALLAPMIHRGWVERADKQNPGLWVYTITHAGWEALKLVKDPPVTDVYPPEHARPPVARRR